MRILMIMPIYPIPTDSGEKRRMFAFMQELSKRHQVVIASLSSEDSKFADIENRNCSWEVYAVPHSYRKFLPIVQSFLSTKTYREKKFDNSKLKEGVSELLDNDNFDVVWVNFLNMTVYIEKYFDIWKKNPHTKPILVLDQHNLDEFVWKSFLTKIKSPFHKIFCAWEVYKNRKLQNLFFQFFDIILSVSEFEKKITEQYGTVSKNVILAPNGVDINYFKPMSRHKNIQNPTIVFGGSLDVIMNQDAIRWFIKEVFPLVKRSIPDIRFLVVGRKPPRAILNLNKTDSSIIIVNDPSDIREFYLQADAFVVPLRCGGGTKLKTLEGMAMALPVVSTSVGAQGLNNIISGKHLYIENDPETFAARIVEVLRDKEKAENIGWNAREFVESHFSWENIVRRVEVELMVRMQSKCDNR